MSVATEFAPAVLIPARARPAGVGAAPVQLATVAVLHRPQTQSVAAPLRLTRRGVLVLAMVVAAVGAALLCLAARSASAPPTTSVAPHAVSVAPGDTLWSIASRVAPQRDPRAEVAALQRRNHLTDTDLTPGQRLLVP